MALKKRFFAVAYLAIFCFFIAGSNYGYCQQEKGFSEAGANGAFWHSLNDNEKFAFISGVLIGIKTFAESEPDITNDPKLNDAVNQVFYSTLEFLSPDLSIEGIKIRLDKFYEEKSNENIPIYEALRLICGESYDGSADVEFDREKVLNKLREKYKK